MSERDALMRHIIENPDDDVPRLVFADWLSERGSDARAEFIRVQCELARLTPADERWVDLRIRERQLLMMHEADWQWREGGADPEPVSWHPPRRSDEELPDWERGFPGWPSLDHRRALSMMHTSARAVAIRHILEHSPARQFRVRDLRPRTSAATLLAAPGVSGLTGVWVESDADREAATHEAATLAAWPAGLRRLRFHSAYLEAPALRVLGHASFLSTLRELSLASRSDEPGSLADFLCRTELEGLESLALRGSFPDSIDVIRIGERAFPNLHTLCVRRMGFPSAGWGSLLHPKGMPKLCSLSLGPEGFEQTPELLALLESEQLCDLTWQLGSVDIHRARLLGGLKPLRRLSLPSSHGYEDVLVELAVSDGLRDLRWLDLSNNFLNAKGLEQMFEGQWRRLAWLDVAMYVSHGTATQTRAALASLELAELRHLNLSGWRVGALGARVLSKRPCLGELRSLCMRDCGISAKGAAELIESPHLGKLEFLDLSGNSIRGELPGRPGLLVRR